MVEALCASCTVTGHPLLVLKFDYFSFIFLVGHTDTVTSLSLSPDGCYLLSNSMDNTLRIFDVRPFAPIERCVKVLLGAQHNFEKNLIKVGRGNLQNKNRIIIPNVSYTSTSLYYEFIPYF